MKKLNIVHICDHLGWPGSRMHGVKRLFAWILPRFDPQRFNVSLVSLRKKDLAEDTLESLGISVTYLHKSKFDPATLPVLLKVLKRQQADLVHMHGYGATTFGRLAAAWMGIPALLHEHANLTDTPWFQKVADKTLAPFTDLAIAVSQSTADFVVRARLVPATKTRVVYLGVPLEEFACSRSLSEVKAARQTLKLPHKVPMVGTITRLMPSKGNQYFIEAAKHVSQQIPDVHFVIVGEGELQPQLEAQVRELGLTDRVIFTGFVRDVPATLSVLDVVVFPSLWEGTPLTVFEALAMGKPIVSTDADGLKDILTDGYDAIVAPCRDARALADGMLKLLRDAGLRATLGEHARVTGARYDINVFVKKLERLYGVLHDTSRRTRRGGAMTSDLSFLADGARP